MTRVDMQGREPREVWSINLEGVKFYITLIIGAITLALSIWGFNVFSAQHVFAQELSKFHAIAKPEISLLVDARIAQHRAEAMLEYTQSMVDLEKQLATIEERLHSTDQRMMRIEQMVQRLYEQRFGKNG